MNEVADVYSTCSVTELCLEHMGDSGWNICVCCIRMIIVIFSFEPGNMIPFLSKFIYRARDRCEVVVVFRMRF